MAQKRQLKAGATVTYHSPGGDRDAVILRFNGVGGANLELDGGPVLVMSAREGRNAGEWTANPPRRGT